LESLIVTGTGISGYASRHLHSHLEILKDLAGKLQVAGLKVRVWYHVDYDVGYVHTLVLAGYVAQRLWWGST
jgi:hypothetical protein